MNSLPRHVYAIGIAGVGVSGMARWFRQQGCQVSGSDPRHSPLVDDLRQIGVDIVQVPDGRRLDGVDLVIYSDDVPPDQPERLAASTRGLTCWSFAEALGQAMRTRPQRIAVAGTNGKSTTSAMLGLLLMHAKLDPTVFVGSRVNEFAGNMRMGNGPHFVAEADEYRDHFLHLPPSAAIITNVELDHVEYFQTVDRMERSYIEFVDRLGPDGILVINGDDPAARRLWSARPGTLTFGFDPSNRIRIVDYRTAEEQETFSLEIDGTRTSSFTLHVPGTYNVMNAVGAMVMANALGVAYADMIEPLAAFRGIWRRFEVLNPRARTLVINDYAHHPTSVKATIAGARAFYPTRRIIAVFQPHHRHRLQALFNDFADSFDGAHEMILTDVYAVPGREVEDYDLPTSKDLAAAMIAHGARATYAPSLTDVTNALAKLVQPGDAILLMGAGDIWTLTEPLVQAYGT